MPEGSAEAVAVDLEAAGPALPASLAPLPSPLLPLLPLLPQPVAPLALNTTVVTSGARVTSAALVFLPSPPASHAAGVSPTPGGGGFRDVLLPAGTADDGDAVAAGASSTSTSTSTSTLLVLVAVVVVVVPAAERVSRGALARALVAELDLDPALAGRVLHVAAGHVRLAVRAAHRPLILAPLARAEALAHAAGPGSSSSSASSSAGGGVGVPGARPLTGHADAGGAVAGRDAQVAARLVGDAVRAADGSLALLAAATDVGAGAGA